MHLIHSAALGSRFKVTCIVLERYSLIIMTALEAQIQSAAPRLSYVQKCSSMGVKCIYNVVGWYW